MEKNISIHTLFFQSIKSGLIIPGNDQSKDACIRKIILFPLKNAIFTQTDILKNSYVFVLPCLLLSFSMKHRNLYNTNGENEKFDYN